jgi:putative intracellular protease/amidase
VFYPGGHGPLWDQAEDPDSIRRIDGFAASGHPIAAVGHAPAIFRHARGVDGTPLVSGRAATGFANTEEAAADLTHVVPFLVQDMLVANGGVYSKGADWASHVVVDGKLVTGQNRGVVAAGGRCAADPSALTRPVRFRAGAFRDKPVSGPSRCFRRTPSPRHRS